jgi:hypothetical protein
MAALTKERDTKYKEGSQSGAPLQSLPVAATTVLWAGSLVCDNGSGYAIPGSTATTQLAIGRCESTVDNNPGAAGDLNVTVRRGIFKFANSSAGDLIAIDDRLADCFIVDDQTVALTNGGGTRSKAGVIWDVDADGEVWVLVGFLVAI